MNFKELLNGKKFNTGMLIGFIALILKAIGVDESQTTEIATNIMLGIGAIIAAIGYIHRWIKSLKK